MHSIARKKTAISILVISNHTSFQVLFNKLLLYILYEKYIYILALEIANPRNQLCWHTFIPYWK